MPIKALGGRNHMHDPKDDLVLYLCCPLSRSPMASGRIVIRPPLVDDRLFQCSLSQRVRGW